MFRVMLAVLAVLSLQGCEKNAAAGDKAKSSGGMVATAWTGPTMPVPDYGYTEDGRKIWAVSEDLRPTLINGNEIPAGTYKEVVGIKTGNAGCTATIVGPKVVVTAAHCGNNGDTSTFTLGGTSFSGKFERSSLYPAQDHDVAVIILTSEVVKGTHVDNYSTVGGTAVVGQTLTLLGYGCTQPGGGGAPDGKLRFGTAKMKSFSGFDVVSGGGAALCFGDSGGPGFFSTSSGNANILLTVNSKGNIRDTNYTARLDVQESKTFLQQMVTKHTVDICGINKDCGVAPPPPPPPPPPGGCVSQEQKATALLSVASCLQIPIIIPTL